jgi:tripartite ATP-independent transporter DctM subunit
MSEMLIGLIITLVMLALMMMGTHVGFTLLFFGVIGYAGIGGLQAGIGNLTIIPFEKMNSYHFAVIPLFLLMSEFVGQSAMGRETYETARAWLGQFKGGLAMATIGACGLFACVSGSSLAGTVVMGRVAYPEMKRHGYSDLLSSGVTAAGGTLGILIPPSMGFVLIGILADLSIGKLFLAGIIPGITVGLFYMITIMILSKLNPKMAPQMIKTTAREKLLSMTKTCP